MCKEGGDMKIYTPEEAAKELKLSVQTVWKYIREGKLKAARFGKTYRISEEQLQEFFEKMTKDSGD